MGEGDQVREDQAGVRRATASDACLCMRRLCDLMIRYFLRLWDRVRSVIGGGKNCSFVIIPFGHIQSQRVLFAHG